MDEKRWKVGELARVAGVTVRTLHHWDELGLLEPSERSAAGYRLYGPDDVRRLYRILALRGLGLSLEDVRAALDEDGDLRDLVRRQLEQLERRMELERRLREQLVRVLEAPDTHPLIETIEAMSMIERHYTPEQLAQLRERGEQLGQDRIEEYRREWAELIAAVEAERERGTDPSDPKVRRLAARWKELVEAFTGGDPGIRASLERMYAEEGVERASRGTVSPELMEYVRRAGG